MSLCSLGIFGTKYDRASPIPSQLLLRPYDTQYEIKITHIASKYTIGNTLDVKVRVKDQGSFPWVSVICHPAYCTVTFTNTGSISGSKLVVLQSYDDNSLVKSTLVEDTVTVCFDCSITYSRSDALAPAYHLPTNNLYELMIAHL